MHDVLVVGGGPVGLWLACELRRGGVAVTVLEARPARSPHSKALTVHPRTLEILASRGAEGPFLAEGVRLPTGHFGGLAHRLDFTRLDTRFPFTLLLPQVRTEELLEAQALALGVRLVRDCAVTGLRQGDESVEVEAGGERLEARWVVGCDGTRSAVRQAAGIGFPGTDDTVWGWLGDVSLDAPPPGPVMRSSEQGGFMVVPLPGGRHRFVGTDVRGLHAGRAELGFEELREAVVRIGGTDFGMRDPVWLSRFGNASRLAETYRRGRVLLAGDAAHQHFPAGGVGLNVGIHDAHALGARLAAVIRGEAPGSTLDAYDAERRPVGAELLRSTQAQTVLLTHFDPDHRQLASLLSDLVRDVPQLEQRLARKLAGLDVV